MTQQQTPRPAPNPMPAEPQPKRSRLWLWITLGVVVLAAAGAAVYATRPSHPHPAPMATVTIQGDITVPADLYSQGFKGGDCTSDNGYTDIATGSQVTITNQAGTVLHTGTLGNGHTSATLPDANGGDPFADKCTYHFLIGGVPSDATNYGVAVGNTFRGIIHFTREQVNGFIHLNLG